MKTIVSLLLVLCLVSCSQPKPKPEPRPEAKYAPIDLNSEPTTAAHPEMGAETTTTTETKTVTAGVAPAAESTEAAPASMTDTDSEPTTKPLAETQPAPGVASVPTAPPSVPSTAFQS